MKVHCPDQQKVEVHLVHRAQDPSHRYGCFSADLLVECHDLAEQQVSVEDQVVVRWAAETGCCSLVAPNLDHCLAMAPSLDDWVGFEEDLDMVVEANEQETDLYLEDHNVIRRRDLDVGEAWDSSLGNLTDVYVAHSREDHSRGDKDQGDHLARCVGVRHHMEGEHDCSEHLCCCNAGPQVEARWDEINWDDDLEVVQWATVGDVDVHVCQTRVKLHTKAYCKNSIRPLVK